MTNKENISNIEQEETAVPEFDNKEIGNLSGMYADKIIYEADESIIEIKKTILIWNKNILSLLQDQEKKISVEELKKITDLKELKKILKTVIYSYLVGGLIERKRKEKLIMEEMEEINGLKLSTVRLLRKINIKMGNTSNFGELKKRLSRRQTKVEEKIIEVEEKPKKDEKQKKYKIKEDKKDIENKNTSVKNYEYLRANISSESVNNEVKLIMKKLEVNGQIKGSLAKIRKIKNSKGEVVLRNFRGKPMFHEKAAPDLIAMAVEFHKITGNSLNLGNGFRTYSEQKKLKRENPPNIPTAPAGKSRHNSGIAFDVKKKSRYHKKIGGINGFRALASKHNFDKINSEDRHFEHHPMKVAIGRTNRIKVSRMLDKNYEKYWA